VLSGLGDGRGHAHGPDDNPRNYHSARRVTARVVVSRARLANP
jgi:hypothetical protein